MAESITLTDKATFQQSEVSQYVLECQDFSLYYGKKMALLNISMPFPAHQVTAIIGPSGCGKSTLLRSFNRMNDLIPSCRTSGKILFANQNIYERNVDVVALRRKIGMVFQKPNPFPKSIYANVAFGVKISQNLKKSELDEIVEKSLRSAALWDEVKDRLDQNALALSGGQQQRLCIARALAVEPEILLMDEPTSALDPRATARIEELIFELRGSYTIIIVTHNMQQAARVSDISAFLFEGELIEVGLTKEIFTRPRQQLTQDYITGRFS